MGVKPMTFHIPVRSITELRTGLFGMVNMHDSGVGHARAEPHG